MASRTSPLRPHRSHWLSLMPRRQTPRAIAHLRRLQLPLPASMSILWCCSGLILTTSRQRDGHRRRRASRGSGVDHSSGYTPCSCLGRSSVQKGRDPPSGGPQPGLLREMCPSSDTWASDHAYACMEVCVLALERGLLLVLRACTRPSRALPQPPPPLQPWPPSGVQFHRSDPPFGRSCIVSALSVYSVQAS